MNKDQILRNRCLSSLFLLFIDPVSNYLFDSPAAYVYIPFFIYHTNTLRDKLLVFLASIFSKHLACASSPKPRLTFLSQKLSVVDTCFLYSDRSWLTYVYPDMRVVFFPFSVPRSLTHLIL